jgi:CPA2 family monovalent cation:H+ antiporter-2/glutathione-regulated potassium-efflux system ancillary protein KefC
MVWPEYLISLAQQQSQVFLEIEAKHKNNLYHAWLKMNEDEGHVSHVQELFMNLESALKEEMDKDRSAVNAKRD